MKGKNGICPTCYYHFDADTNIHDEMSKPKAGDISICLNCGEVMEYDNDLNRKKMPYDEIEKLSDSVKVEVLRIKLARKQVIKTDLRPQS